MTQKLLEAKTVTQNNDKKNENQNTVQSQQQSRNGKDKVIEVKTSDEAVQPEIVINRKTYSKTKSLWKLGNKNFNTHYFDVNENGVLIAREGNYIYNLQTLTEKYGSPLEIFFPFILKERIEDLIDLFRLFIKYYKYRGKFYYHFPMKVNQNKETILSLVTEGANLEVGSSNELSLVKKMWEQGSFHSGIRVMCNGPKTENYLNLIDELYNNNLTIVPIIEHIDELHYLKNYKGDVGIRADLNVRVSSHWDKKINRFGFLPEEILRLGKIRNLKVLHYHIGSQIEFSSDILSPIKKAMDLYIKIREHNPTLDTINIGGGMPIPYDRTKQYGVENIIKNTIRVIQKIADKKDIPHPNIVCEWGRYVVAPSQITIFKVIGEKKIPKGNAKKWYLIDGCFINDLLDTWAIRQKWHVVPVNRLYTKQFSRTWIAGSSCDSDDKYINHGSYILLPGLQQLKADENMYIAFLDTGAYQDALGSHHCLLSNPARISVQNGETQLIRRHETADDIGKIFGW